MEMEQILEKSKAIKPYSNKNGRQAVTFEDYGILANKDGIDRMMGHVTDTGDRKMNIDGTVASSRAPYVAVSEEKMLDNRFRVTAKELHVVVDQRILHELRNNNQNCPYKQITEYVIKKNTNDEYYLDRIGTISDAEFMAKYTDRLKPEQMKQIWHLIEGAGEINEPSEMPI